MLQQDIDGYGMKTNDDAIKALRTWYADTADLRTKHKVVVLMRDNAFEYKSEEMMQFLESKGLGIRSHFSTPKEQWQNCAAESTVNFIMMSARTVMAESGLGGRFWFKDARNVTYTERIGMSPYQAMHGLQIQGIRLQGLGISRQAAPRKGKAHAESQRGNFRWVQRQHERVGILNSGSENYAIKSDQGFRR